MELLSPREAAAFALSLLDLTNLRDDCDYAAIEKLCQRAQTPYGNTAAICIWPRFVAHARQILGSEHPVRIATVVNFLPANWMSRPSSGRRAKRSKTAPMRSTWSFPIASCSPAMRRR